MNIKIFNYCIITGWLMLVAGSMILSIGWGLIVGGLSMIFLTLLGIKIAGIIESPAVTDKAEN